MRKIMFAVPAAALMLGFAGDASAQDATVTYEVAAINQFALSANPAKLMVSTAVAGSAPTPATDSGTTWAITTNEDNRNVTAQIGAALPTGLTLEVTLAKPAGTSASAGAVALSTTAANVVTGLSKVQESGMGVTYKLSATTAAGKVAEQTATVTYTIIAGPVTP